MKLHELKRGVDKGSQKRAKHPLATDSLGVYLGKWEEYTEPQGIKKESSMFGAGWTGSPSPSHTTPMPDEMFNKPPKEIKQSKKAPLKKANDDVKNTTNGMVDGIQVLETITPITTNKLNGEYYVMDGDKDAGYALVNDSILGQIVINTEIDAQNTGEILHKILLLITREADWIDANLSTQLKQDTPVEIKRMFEQFGFRATHDGIMTRTSNSATPPESY